MKFNNQNLILIIIVIIIILVIMISFTKTKQDNEKTEGFNNYFEENQKAYYKGRNSDINNAIYNDAERFFDVTQDNTGNITLNIDKKISNNKSDIDIQVEKCKKVTKCSDLDKNPNCGICLDSGEGMYGDKNGPLVNTCSGGWVTSTNECIKEKERRICAKVKNCAQMTGEASICGWCIGKNRAMVAKREGNKLVPKYPEDKCGTRGLIAREDCNKVFMSSSCIDTWYTGNHSKQCLNDIWNWAGCSRQGARAPDNMDDKQRTYWNSRDVMTVLDDMMLHKKLADSYNINVATKYYPMCYGGKLDPCSNKFKVKPASCYQNIFKKSGCLEKGTYYPTKTPKMTLDSYKNQIRSIIATAHNKSLDYETRNASYNQCYGRNLVLPSTKDIDLQPGLNAYIYENLYRWGRIGAPLRNQPIRINNISFDWGYGKVFGVQHDRVFVIIEGNITYPKSATTVKYRVGTSDFAILYVNGNVQLYNWGYSGFRWREGKPQFTNNTTDTFQLLMSEWGGNSQLKLEWSIDDGKWSKIPDRYFSSSVIKRHYNKDQPKYIGCFRDNSRRAMPHLITRKGTFNDIIRLAKERGFKYVGLQYGNGFDYNYAEAWGSNINDYDKYGSASCSKLKTGEITGIGWSNAVYKLR
jgi:uncharacterized protein YxeA